MQIFEICREQDIKVIYSSIFPPGDIEIFSRPFWEPTTIDSLMMVNDEIRVYCQEKGFIWLDTYDLLESKASPGTVLKKYQPGFLHINSEGYHLISEALRNLLTTSDEDWVD